MTKPVNISYFQDINPGLNSLVITQIFDKLNLPYTKEAEECYRIGIGTRILYEFAKRFTLWAGEDTANTIYIPKLIQYLGKEAGDDVFEGGTYYHETYWNLPECDVKPLLDAIKNLSDTQLKSMFEIEGDVEDVDDLYFVYDSEPLEAVAAHVMKHVGRRVVIKDTSNGKVDICVEIGTQKRTLSSEHPTLSLTECAIEDNVVKIIIESTDKGVLRKVFEVYNGLESKVALKKPGVNPVEIIDGGTTSFNVGIGTTTCVLSVVPDTPIKPA